MKIAVIGAGIVGLSTANWLKNYGQETILFDMHEPGSQTSFGNAGTYAQYANIPTNSPSFLYLFPKAEYLLEDCLLGYNLNCSVIKFIEFPDKCLAKFFISFSV